MPETTITILKGAIILLDVIILLSLLINILGGLRKGLIQTSLVFASKIMPLLIMLLFTNLIGKAVINAEFSFLKQFLDDNATISEYLQSMAATEFFDGSIEQMKLAGVDKLINSVLISAVGALIYIISSLIILLIISPIIRLVLRLTLPFARRKSHNIGSRLLGALVGCVASITFFAILLLPVYGAFETTQVIINEFSLQDESSSEISDDLNAVFDSSIILKATSNVGKGKNGKFGIGAKRLGNVLTIKTEYGKVNLLKEVEKVLPLVPRILEISEEFSTDKTTNEKLQILRDQDIDDLTNYLANSNLIKVVYPITINFLEYSKDDIELLKDLSLNYDELRNVNINKDFENISPILKNVLKLAKNIDLENIEYEAILEDDTNIELTINIVGDAFSLEIMDKFLSKILINYLDTMLEENKLTNLTGIINNEYLKNNFANDLRKIKTVYDILDETKIIEYFKNEDAELEVTDEIKTKLGNAIDQIFSLKLLENHEKQLVQTAFMFVEVEGISFEEMFNENINWKQEVNSFGDMIVDIFELIVVAKLNQDDLTTVLENEHIIEVLTNIIDQTFKMQLADKYFVPLIIEYIDQFLVDNDLAEFSNIINAEYLKNDLTKDIKILIDEYKVIKETGIIEYFNDKENSTFIIDEEVKTKLQIALNKIIELKLLENNEKVFIKKILTFIPEDMNINLDEMMQENIDWQIELKGFAEIIIDAIEFMVKTDFNQDNLTTLLDNENTKLLLPALIDKIFNLQTAEKYISPIIINYITEMFAGTDLEKLTNYITTSYLKNDFSTDIDDLLDIYNLSNELKITEHFDNSSEYKMDLNNEEVLNKFRSFVTKIFDLKLINGHEEKVIKGLFEQFGTNDLISVDALNFENINWDNETINLTDITVELIKLMSIDNSLSSNFIEEDNYEEISNQYAKVFDAMIKSDITRGLSFDLVDKLVDASGYDVTFSDIEKQQIINNTAVYEFKILTDVVKYAQDVLVEDENGNNDFTKLKGSDVTKIMLDASDGVIASKVVGTLITEALGPDGIDKLPTDSEGNSKYDFTNPEVLKAQAETIGKTFDLANTMNSIEMDNITTENIETLVDSIASLDNENIDNEFVQDMLNEFTTEEVVLPDNVDWNKEATLVQDVLNEYKNTDNKDNFNLEDYPELSENVNNSDVAKAVLEYLGIKNN